MNRSEVFAELSKITEAICEGRASDEDKDRLKELVLNDEEAKRFYFDLMDKQAINEDEEFESTLKRLLVDKERLVQKEQQAPITQVLRKPEDLALLEPIANKKKLNHKLIVIVVVVVVLLAFSLIFYLN